MGPAVAKPLNTREAARTCCERSHAIAAMTSTGRVLNRVIGPIRMRSRIDGMRQSGATGRRALIGEITVHLFAKGGHPMQRREFLAASTAAAVGLIGSKPNLAADEQQGRQYFEL